MNISVKSENFMIIDGKMYKAFPYENACEKCAFNYLSIATCFEANCMEFERRDKKQVAFKQVQKVSLFEYTFNKDELVSVKHITSRFIPIDEVTDWLKKHNELLDENKRWEFVKSWK